jgi:CDP-2,3-bis-(O-geranylgeranyl)-sn-glycerol synthase
MTKKPSIAVLAVLAPLPIIFYLNANFNVYPITLIIRFLPAFCAPLVAPISMLLPKTHPIDFGAYLGGQRLFGDKKTIEGTFAAIIVATGLGVALSEPLVGFVFAVGAMLGDLLNSFIKRRLKIPPGNYFPIMDELNFLFFPVIFALSFFSITSLDVLILGVLTMFLHYLYDRVALFTGFKKREHIDIIIDK